MPLKQTVCVYGMPIGQGHMPLFLADIGTFFNQNISLGCSLIERIHAAGLVMIKGEILHDPNICLDTDLEEVITCRDARITKENYRRVIERKVISLSEYERLFNHARQLGLGLALSVYDEIGLRFALEQGAALIKIASSNIVHRPLIEKAASCGVPILMDTGKATLIEISRAVSWFVNAGGNELLLEHSPAGPPAPVTQHNLGMMRVMRECFRCPVGLSDHHYDDEMLYAAIAIGANIIEKGVSPDDLQSEQDLGHALPIGKLATVVKKCDNVYTALDGIIPELVPDRSGHPARMGLVAACDLFAGHKLKETDLTYAFPAIGIPVECSHLAIGKHVRYEIRRGIPIRWSDLQLNGDGSDQV